IILPSLEEQAYIGNLLSKVDNLINLKEKKVNLLRQQKQGLLQKMFI
ncbi:restriction endonuclease subunit S, partial [Staphylococcus massiliensis CCUG 55927]